FQQLRLPFIQSLFSISKFDLGLELWLPSEQHTGNGLRESGSKCFALAKLTKSVTGRGINCYQYRGAGCQEKKYLAARLGEEFSLDSPFYRTAPFIEHLEGSSSDASQIRYLCSSAYDCVSYPTTIRKEY